MTTTKPLMPVSNKSKPTKRTMETYVKPSNPMVLFGEDALESPESSPEAETGSQWSTSPPALTKPKMTSSLGKGRACVKCRARKMRCDGKRPSCASCIRARRDCVYEEEKTRTKRLMDKIEELEAKLRGLELELTPSVVPESKYQGQKKSRLSFKNPMSNDNDTKPPKPQEPPESPPRAPTPDLDFASEWWKADPPAPHYQEHLVDLFLAFKKLPAFHVHDERFRESLLHPPPNRPALPALQNAVFMVGCHFSDDSRVNACEPHFLDRTRTALATTLHNEEILHTNMIPWLQAAALVSYYFCRVGRWLEAHHQVAGAANVALGCNIHKIRSSIWLPSDAFHVEKDTRLDMKAGVYTKPMLSPPKDPIELFERIGIFWQIWMLDHSTALVTGLPHSIPDQEIETVWPRPFEEIETGIDPAGDGSIASLYGPNPAPPYDPPCTMHALRMKVVALVSRMGDFEASSTPAFRRKPEFYKEFTMYHHAVQQFTEGLPPFQQYPVDYEVYAYPPPPFNLGLLVVHTFAHVAATHLYGALDYSEGQYEEMYQHRLNSAKKACSLIRALNASGASPAKLPIMMGFAWCAVAVVVGKHYKRLQRLESNDPRLITEMSETLDDLEVIMGAVQEMSVVFPLLGYQLEKQKSEGFDTATDVESPGQ